MNTKMVSFLAICVFSPSILFSVILATDKYISDCLFYDDGPICCNDIVTFICSDRDREQNSYFEPSIIGFDCSNISRISKIPKTYVGSVYFRDCELLQIPNNFFDNYMNVYTLDISNIHLKYIPIRLFKNSTKLSKIIAKNNQLTEIVDGQFRYAPSLSYVDWSHNFIGEISRRAFDHENSIKTLLLSHNHISEILPRTLDPLVILEELDLSYNAIEYLSNETFTELTRLRYLDLSHNRLGNINPGTFSKQRKLTSLNLSFNLLKVIDFKLFSPRFEHLDSFFVSGNQLTDLDGFSFVLFPELKSLGMTGNNFNCSYLRIFFESFNSFEYLETEWNFPNRQGMSVHGISCELNQELWTPGDVSPHSANDSNNSDQIIAEYFLLKLRKMMHVSYLLSATFVIFLVLSVIVYFQLKMKIISSETERDCESHSNKQKDIQIN